MCITFLHTLKLDVPKCSPEYTWDNISQSDCFIDELQVEHVSFVGKEPQPENVVHFLVSFEGKSVRL